jgi:hypothetical protein
LTPARTGAHSQAGTTTPPGHRGEP